MPDKFIPPSDAIVTHPKVEFTPPSDAIVTKPTDTTAAPAAPVDTTSQTQVAPPAVPTTPQPAKPLDYQWSAGMPNKLAEGHEQDIVDYVNVQEKAYRRINEVLNKQVEPDVPAKPDKAILHDGLKALELGEFLQGGGNIDATETSQYTRSTNIPALGISIPRIPVPGSKEYSMDYTADNTDGKVFKMFSMPDSVTKEEMMKTGDASATAIRTTIAKLEADKAHLKDLDSGADSGDTGGLRPYEFHQKNQNDMKDIDTKIAFLTNNLANLKAGTGKLIATYKAFQDDFSNPETIQKYAAMGKDQLMNTAITEQAAVVNATDLKKYTDELTRATSLDPMKKIKSQATLEGMDPTFKAHPIAVKLTYADTDDVYQMNHLRRQELGYGGMTTLLGKLNQAQSQDIAALTKFETDRKDAEEKFKADPTKDTLKALNDIIDAKNEYIKTNLEPKNHLYDNLRKTIDEQFVGLRVHDFLQKQVDDLNKGVGIAIKEATLGTVQDAVYNEVILGTYAFAKDTKNRIATGLGKMTPEQEYSAGNQLEENMQEWRKPTSSYWQQHPAVSWDEKGFKINPLTSLHSMVDMTTKLGLFAAGSLAGEGALAGVADVAGVSAAERAASYGWQFAGFNTRVASMASVIAAMDGHEMLMSEEAKGLPAGEAYKIALMRNIIQSYVQEAIFSPAHLLKAAPVAEDISKIKPEIAFKQAAASYNKVFGKELSPETYKYLFDTKQFLKDAVHPLIAQSAVAVTNDLADHALSAYLQKHGHPDYEVRDVSFKSEFLNVMNTIASMVPIGIQEGFKGHSDKVANSISAARYLVGKEADLHYKNIQDNLDNGVITPEVAAGQTKLVADLEEVHILTEPIFGMIDKTRWSAADKERNKVEAFKNTEAIATISEAISENPQSKDIEKLNKFLLRRTQDNLDLQAEVADASKPETPEEIETRRVKDESAFLKTEYSDTAIDMKLDRETIYRELDRLQENAEKETNPELKKLYEDRVAKMNERLDRLETDFPEGRTIGWNSVTNKFHTQDKDGNILESGFDTKAEAEDAARNFKPEQPTTELEPREDLAQYAKDNLGLKQTEIDDMTHEDLQKAVVDHRDLKSGKVEADVTERIAAAKAKPTLDEQSTALHDLFMELSTDPAKTDLANKVHEEFDKVDDQIKKEKEAGNQFEFQGRTFTKGNYLNIDGYDYKIVGVDAKDPAKPMLIVEGKGYHLKIKNLSKAGAEITPSEFAAKMNSKFGKPAPPEPPTDAETAKEEPTGADQPPVGTDTSKKEAKQEQDERKVPVNPARTIREENPDEPTHQTWVSSISKIAKEVPGGDFLKQGYSIVVMNSRDIPIEHMNSGYKKFLDETLKGDRTKDTGKHAVIADASGKPIVFDDNGEKSDKGHWAISEIPVVRNEGIADRLSPTEERLTALGKTKEWFKEQIKKLKAIRSAKDTQQFTIAGISEGTNVQDYSQPKRVEKTTGGKALSVKISDGKDINGYTTKKGYLYATIDGQKEPIRLEKPGFTNSDIDAIINLSKKTVPTAWLESLPEDVRAQFNTSRKRMEYLRKLVYSGLNTDIDFRYGSDHGVYKVVNGVHTELMTDEQLRAYLKDRGVNVDSNTLNQDNKFDYLGWDGEKFTNTPHEKYSDFIKDKFTTYTEATNEKAKTGQYVEFGDPIESLPGKIDKAATEPPAKDVSDIEKRRQAELEGIITDFDFHGIKDLVGKGIIYSPAGKFGLANPDGVITWHDSLKEAQDAINKKYDAEVNKAATLEVKIEVSKPTEEAKPGDNIVKDSPTKPGRKKKAKIEDVDKSELGSGLKDESGELTRSKRLLNNTTAEEDRIAKAWFDANPISKHVKFEDMRAIINSDAWATWSKAAITLWNGGKYSDLYHEAWHEFSQKYLDRDQKRALYDEIAKTKDGIEAMKDKTTQLERDKAIEELIAEDFRKYVLSNGELVLGNRPERNKWYQKIWAALKEFFTGNTSLQTMYERLHKGELNKYSRSDDNAMFGNLTKGLEGVVRDTPESEGRVFTLDNRQTRNLYRAIDSLVGQMFARAGKPITMMFDKNNVLNKTYNEINNHLKNEYNATIDKIDELYDRLDALKDEKAAAQVELELQHYNNLSDNLQFTIQNWEMVVKNHKDFSPFMNISKDHVTFDSKGDIIDTEGDESNDQENSRDASVVKRENGAYSKEAASNETVYLIATLPRFNKSGVVAKNEFLSNVDDTVDFTNTWNTLSHELAGIFDYDQMMSKVKELGASRPEFLELSRRLVDPDQTLPLTAAELRLRNAFINDLSKPIVLVKEVVASKTGPRLQFFYSKAAPTSLDMLKHAFSDGFQNFSPEEHGDYVKRDEESGNIHLNEPAITKDFYDIFVNNKNKSPEEIRDGKIQFLELLGYAFSNDTLNDPDFLKALDDKKGPAYQLYNGLKYVREAYSAMGKLITNPIEDLGRDHWSNGKLISRGQRQNINDLVNFELANSENFFTENATNANGDTVWQKQDKNYITNVFSHLNNVGKYPTYSALLSEPHMQQFDVDKNPFMNGLFINSIFKLDVPKDNPLYGTRRTIKVGGVDTPVQISLDNYNGLRVDIKDGQGGTANDGKTTTELTAFEKLIQNFNSLLTSGIVEHIRYGDKSSAYATSINGLYDPYSGKVDNRKLFIPINDFQSSDWSSKVNQEGMGVDYMPETLFRVLKMYLLGDILPMRDLKLDGKGKNWHNFNKNGEDFGVMESFLSDETKKKLLDSPIFKDGEANTEAELKKFDKEIREDFKKFMIKQVREVKENFTNVEDVLKPSDLIDQKLLSGNTFGQLVTAYTANQLISNIEHLKLIAGDPRFSKAKGGKRELYKRLSQFSATGNHMVVDRQTNETIEAHHPRLFRQAIIDRDGTPIELKREDGHINSAIFKDIEYKSDRLLAVYKEHLVNKLGLTEAEAKSELAKYEDITEADGQGHVTLDEYKQSKLRSGSSHWTPAHEAAYHKEAAFLRGEATEGMSLAETALFPPQKWQMSGPSLDANGNTVPVFYKFSVAPLIPSMIKGTSFEKIHDNLIKQNVGLALFSSGSKHSSVVNAEGKFNPFYSNYDTRTPYEGKLDINKVFYHYLKEQVNIDPKEKDNVVFSTQMRKLLHLNLFTNGVPDDFKGSVDDWNKLTDGEKTRRSSHYRTEQSFGKIIDSLLDLERKNVLRKMGATLKGDHYDLDFTKLADFFQKEFIKRGLPDEAVDFLQTVNGHFKYPLDASTQRDKIEKIAMSIANKKLVQQKVNGDALIQLASSGFELNQSKLQNPTEADLKKWGEGTDLPFYLPDGRKKADGSTVTSAMKVKVAFTDRWKPLLELTHPDGQKIGSVERLNEAIKDEKWMDEADNRKMVSMVGVRIPVQGLNSHEFMEVYHFVPKEAGNIIIISPQIVAKSGGDFDIDKLTTYMPNLRLNEAGKADVFKEKSDKELGALHDQLHTAFTNLKDINKTQESEKLIASTFGTGSAGLDPELVKDLFGTDKVPGRAQFIDWYKKKSLENNLVDHIRETLEKGDNFRQLIRPNDTNLLKPYADMLRGDKEGSWTGLVEPMENLRQFSSNLVGKSNLGIAAVNNTLFALLQRSGMYLNPTYKFTNSSGKKLDRTTNFNMAHNIVNIGGKDFISLAGQTDVEKKHLISDVISQFINGFVDVAKDDWVFYINGVREMVPTMLYATMAGVNHETMLGFFNQPIMREYVREFQKGKSLFMKIKDMDSFNFAKRRATESIFFNTPVDDGAVQSKIDAVKAQYKAHDDLALDIKSLIKKMGREKDEDKQLEMSFKLDGMEEEFRTQSINKNKAFNDLLGEFKGYAAKDKALFEKKKLYDSVFGDKRLGRFDQLKVFAHFLELQEQSGMLTSLQTTINADTRKAASSYSVYDRLEKRKQALDSELFPRHIVDKITNQSTVRAFLHSETGFDNFASKLYNNLFEVTNHSKFNTVLRSLFSDPQYGVPFAKRSELADEFQRTFKNDFLQYIYQNYVYNKGSYDLVSDITRPLFKSKDGLSEQLKGLLVEHPDLAEQFPFLSLLGSDKARKVDIKSVKFRRGIYDADELNSVTQQIRKMQSFSDPDYTPEQQRQIQDFANKYVNFAFMQSGLNRSAYYMTDVIPNESYSPDMTPAILKFREMLERHPEEAEKEIRRYALKFKLNNPRFFDTKKDDTPFNYNSFRRKDYKTTGAADLLGKRSEKKTFDNQQYLDKMPEKVQQFDKTRNGPFIKGKPKDLVVVEDNKIGTIKAQLKGHDNITDLITREKVSKGLSDSDLKANVDLLEAGIQKLIAKSKDFEHIIFPKEGVGMQLKDTAPLTYEFLSNRLHELFGFTNPGFVPKSEAPAVKKDPYELAINKAKNAIFEKAIKKEISFNYLDLPEGYTQKDFEKDDGEIDLDEKYGKPLETPEDWKKAQEIAKRFNTDILTDGGERVSFDYAYDMTQELHFYPEDSYEGTEFTNVEDLMDNWRQDQIPPEVKGQVEDFLKEHGLIKYKTYDPNQLSLFREEDFNQEGCDKPCS